MVLLHTQIFSHALGFGCGVEVLLPELPSDAPAEHEDWPCLYLLHGLSDDQTRWQRQTSLERYCDQLDTPLAVVMPAVHRSFYTDMANGYAYGQFISEELPRKMRQLFRISDRPERTYLAGLSMGGYGAMKLALTHPQRYAAAASLSGSLHLAPLVDQPQDWYSNDVRLVFGDGGEITGTEHDLMHLIDRAAESDTPCPPLYACCGVDDFLISANRRFRQKAERAGLPLTYEEGPGIHDWAYWDAAIQRVLAWLPLADKTD